MKRTLKPAVNAYNFPLSKVAMKDAFLYAETRDVMGSGFDILTLEDLDCRIR